MARRVGLPAPSLTGLGGPPRTFGQYEILDNGSRETGRAFQKAQALWAAGKMDDDAYLAAYAKYVGKLDGTAKINAQQSLDRERYTFARNDIVNRIDGGDESAWDALLAYDRKSLGGLAQDNEEYQRRLSFMRSTQNSIFTNRHNDVIQKVQQGQMTTTQYFNWLVSQKGSGITSGNGALARSIMDRIDATRLDMANERREKVYENYQNGEMSPGEFMNYARMQRGMFAKGTVQRAQWDGRLNGAKLAMQDARMSYRFSLSQNYKRNREWLSAPPPGGGKADKTRTLYKDGRWQEVPVESAPSAGDVAAFSEYEKEKVRIEAEQEAIEGRMSAANLDFIEPRQMAKFYKERKKNVVKGTAEWLALHQKVGEFIDAQGAWDTFTPENGFFPTKVGEKFSDNPRGAKLPGESQITAKTFARQLRAQMGARSGISKVDWKVWAKQYLGDASAKPTPGNLETVTKARLRDMKAKYGSWAMVAKAWVDGTAGGGNVGDWSPDTRRFVNDLWDGMGLGRIPKEFKFTGGQRPDPVTAHPDINVTEPGDSLPIETVDAAGSFAGPEMYAIVPIGGDRNAPSITIQQGKPVPGMGPGEYDNLYDRARNAFMDGQTSFTVHDAYGVTNYFFPSDHAARSKMMMQLDDTRIELKRHEMTQTQQAVNDSPDPTEAQFNAAAEAADKFTKAIDTAGTNVVEMAFAGQQGPEGGDNYNPAADIQRIAEQATAAVELRMADAKEMWEAGATTQAVFAMQSAEDILADVDKTLTILSGQLQSVVKSAQAQGADLPEGQQGTVEGLIDWRETYKLGVDGLVAGSIAADILDYKNKEILPWVAKDSDNNILMTDDGMEVVELPGSMKVLKHNQTGPDTFDRIYIDKDFTSTGPEQDLALEGVLPGHVKGSVMSKGQQIVALVPYTEGKVGYIQLPDGQRAELIGKKFSTFLDGRHQTSVENPLKPGYYSVREDGVDAVVGFIYDAEEGATLDEDEFGNKRVAWKDPEDSRQNYMLAFNATTTSYDILGQYGAGMLGLIDPGEPEATLIGSLNNNPMLAEQMLTAFTRDTKKIPSSQRVASDMLGIQLGMSSGQLNYQAQADQWRAEGGARISAQLRTQERFKQIREMGQSGMRPPPQPIVVPPPAMAGLQKAADTRAQQSQVLATPAPPIRPTAPSTAAGAWKGGGRLTHVHGDGPLMAQPTKPRLPAALKGRRGASP